MTTDNDITEAELQAIQQAVEKDIAKNGIPTDKQLHALIDEINASVEAPSATRIKVTAIPD